MMPKTDRNLYSENNSIIDFRISLSPPILIFSNVGPTLQPQRVGEDLQRVGKPSKCFLCLIKRFMNDFNRLKYRFILICFNRLKNVLRIFSSRLNIQFRQEKILLLDTGARTAVLGHPPEQEKYCSVLVQEPGFQSISTIHPLCYATVSFSERTPWHSIGIPCFWHWPFKRPGNSLTNWSSTTADISQNVTCTTKQGLGIFETIIDGKETYTRNGNLAIH